MIMGTLEPAEAYDGGAGDAVLLMESPVRGRTRRPTRVGAFSTEVSSARSGSR